MPARMRKLPGRSKWRVTDDKGHIHAKATTRSNAQRQVRLLNAVRHGFKPTGRK